MKHKNMILFFLPKSTKKYFQAAAAAANVAVKAAEEKLVFDYTDALNLESRKIWKYFFFKV